MAASRLSIDQLGCCGEGAWLSFQDWSSSSALSPRGATLVRVERNRVPDFYFCLVAFAAAGCNYARMIPRQRQIRWDSVMSEYLASPLLGMKCVR